MSEATLRTARPRYRLFTSGVLGLILAGCAAGPAVRDGEAAREEPAPARPAEGGAAAPGAERPEDPYTIIHGHLSRGDPQQALEVYERTAAGEDRLLYARLLLLAGRREEARRELAGLLAQSADDPAVLFELARLEGAEGRRPAERSLLDRILAVDPGHAPALAARGRIHLEEGEFEEAERRLTGALQRDPSLVTALTGLGDLRRRQRRYPQALELLDRAVRAEPQSPFAYQDRARVKRAQEDCLGAIADLCEALRLDPEDYWSYLDRGDLYVRIQQRESAEQDFSRAVRLDPDGFAAYVYRAGLYYEQDRLAEAVKDYERAIALRPEYPFAYAPLGVLYYLRRQWPEAERMCRAAYRQEPEEHALALLACLALKQQGREGPAREYLSGVLDRMPGQSWQRELARYLLDPGVEFYTVNRINQERNELTQARMLFYVGCQSLLLGRDRQAVSYLLECRDRLRPDFFEHKIASWLLKGEK